MAKRVKTLKSKVYDRHSQNGAHTKYAKYALRTVKGKDTRNVSKHIMQTRSITTALPRNAVLNTTELLEHILLNLLPEDIITACRVNQKFYAVIAHSRKIQVKLNPRPEPVATIWEWMPGEMVVKENKSGVADRGKEWTVPAELNRVFFTEQLGFNRANLQGRLAMCEPIHFNKHLPSLSKKKSPYHGMFLSQPPAKQVEFELYYSKKHANSQVAFRRRNEVVRSTIERPNGVTYGDLIEEFKNALARYETSGDYLLKLSFNTVLYMGGVVFPTEAEREMVKRNGT